MYAKPANQENTWSSSSKQFFASVKRGSRLVAIWSESRARDAKGLVLFARPASLGVRKNRSEAKPGAARPGAQKISPDNSDLQFGIYIAVNKRLKPAAKT